MKDFGISPNTSCRPAVFLFHAFMVTPATLKVKAFGLILELTFEKGFTLMKVEAIAHLG